MTEQPVLDFKDLYRQELELRRAALAKAPEANAPATPQIGLAFSGGGIRSATFNLGILQGLARRGVLKHVDYLSTVSGGGYIGGWYMAFLKRRADKNPRLAEELLNPDREVADGEPYENPAITWLRRFSNYLTPKTGLSGDSLTLVSTYLRNLLLNLTVIISFLALLLLLPRALGWAVPFLWSMHSLPWIATLPLALAVLGLPIQLLSLAGKPGKAGAPRTWQQEHGVMLLAILPILLASYFVAIGLTAPSYKAWAAQESSRMQHLPGVEWLGLSDWLLITQVLTMAVYLMPWLLVGMVALRRGRGLRRSTIYGLSIAALGASLCAGLMFFGLTHLAAALTPTPFELVTFGPPLVLAAFSLAVALHIGLARRHFSDLQREWWARLGGWMLGLTIAWVAFFGIALFGAPVLLWLNEWVAAAGGMAWVGSTLWGVLAGKSARTGAGGSSPVESLLGLVPWLFLAGLIGLLSLVLQLLLGTTPAPALSADLSFAQWRQESAVLHGALGLPSLGLAAMALLGVFVLFGWRIDINLFSFHNFYRNRLTRCYLGASRLCATGKTQESCRQPEPFTGFDPDDDVAVSALGPRPYPLFNTALNLVGGEELAWQQRKAASFCIAPWFSGFEFPLGMETGRRSGYGVTQRFLCGDFPHGGGVRLGTAMAISGAAVNPNMGFHSSPAVSFLLTLFNVRLGRWVGNPAIAKAWSKNSPSFGVRYLYYELFALTTARRNWFNLSDGGHFENLGLYELVRRGLPYIIASDGAEDAGYHFDDLANAIRKIRADLGVDIEIDVSGLRPREAGGPQAAHVAVGMIRYDRVDPSQRPGVLIYLRPGLRGDEPSDVQSYARRNPSFPFQSTADQFFDESQFESYRQLGLHVASGVFREAAGRQDMAYGRFNPESFFSVMRETWRARLPLDETQANVHQAQFDALSERLRTDPDLAFLSWDIFPEWPQLMQQPGNALQLPAYEDQKRAGFYLCREVAQWMEQVYRDRDLDNQHDHPDNRGWMNLFRHWSWSPMFRATYAITAATLSEPFQRFCKRHLDLGLGTMTLRFDPPEAGLPDLNFVERDIADTLIRQLGPRQPGAGPDIQLVRFELFTRYPATQPGVDPVELLRFHCGFALLEGAQLRFFRIQDHLRRMGLARQALTHLLAQHPGLSLELPRAEDEPDLHLNEDELAALQRLFHSVRAIRAQDPQGGASPP